MRVLVRPNQAVGVLAALTIAAVLLTTGLLLWSLRAQELKHAQLETASLAEMLIEQTQQQLEAVDQVLQGVQERLASNYGSQIPLDSELTRLLLATRTAGHTQITALFLLDAQGQRVNASQAPDANTSAASTAAYFTAFGADHTKGVALDRPLLHPGSGRWTLRMARALETPDGKFRGVVVAEIDLASFEAIYYRAKLDFVRPIALYLDDGTLLASWPHRENDLGAKAMELSRQRLTTPGEGVRTLVHAGGDGARVVFALGRVSAFPVLLSVSDDEEQSLASWREVAVPILLSVLLLCLFTLFVAFFLSQKLRREAALAIALSEADNRYLHTVESVKDAIVAVDASMAITLFNPAAEAMFGFSQAQALGQPLSMLLPTHARQRHDALAMAFGKTQDSPRAMAGQLEIFGQRRDGSEFPIESSISKTEIGGKVQMTAVLRDVTEQRRAKGELQLMNSQLRALYVDQQTVREDERTRISRELHDDLGQQLTGLKLNLLWLGGRMKEGRGVDQEHLDNMRRTLNGAISSVRRLSSELRPAILDELGFADAVDWQTRELAKHSGLDIDLRLGQPGLVQGELLATALFRIVQESLTNVVRHANATTVRITLDQTEGKLVLRIKDNGIGLPESTQRQGIGMVSMRERARAVGAQLRVFRRQSGGTTVEVTLDLAAPELPA
jgi:PAS domain S-box-containing protein